MIDYTVTSSERHRHNITPGSLRLSAPEIQKRKENKLERSRKEINWNNPATLSQFESWPDRVTVSLKINLLLSFCGREANLLAG